MQSCVERGLDLVIKVGGATGISYGGFADDLASIVRGRPGGGLRVVVVHGGSHEANTLGELLGKPARFITSPSGHVSRRTDREAMEIMMMAVAGRVNKILVEHLQRSGLNAIGLSGMDGRLLLASRKTAVKYVENGKTRVLRDDLSGKVEKVNAPLVSMLVDAGCVPVVSPLAISLAGEPLNVDADRCAAAIAGAFRAERLIILSNIPGLLRDPSDTGTLVRLIPARSLAAFEQYATGRMKKKLVAAAEALEGGVEEVVIGDARVERPVRHAMSGGGTMIR
ncbi:MAG: [LysW]-aminoadipate kinase [Ignavibacteriales bacterium]